MFVCINCEKSFDRKYNYNRHINLQGNMRCKKKHDDDELKQKEEEQKEEEKQK